MGDVNLDLLAQLFVDDVVYVCDQARSQVGMRQEEGTAGTLPPGCGC